MAYRSSSAYDAVFVLPRKESEWVLKEPPGELALEMRESSFRASGKHSAETLERTSVTGERLGEEKMFLRLVYRLAASSPAHLNLSPSQNRRCLQLVMPPPLDRLETPETIERQHGPDECFILESTRAAHREQVRSPNRLDLRSILMTETRTGLDWR